ncbi:FCS-Like Zinc finger 1 [Camellia lanceoleosa]|uniref:FCS-Like Zinc finger 1 n=1 Tax=Camellia lanceoleosa TaxID=1840588 RepID=A0ACC0I942_9ERIC|nr:FCS-Like Zinc finger 1 [Camellia lanceoleosa]
MEAGFSGNNHHHHHNHHFFSRPLRYVGSHRRGSMRSLSSFSGSPRSGRFYDGGRFEEYQPHFLHACYDGRRFEEYQPNLRTQFYFVLGDTPFCSEECRQEQIEIDETKEKKSNVSDSMKALRKDEKRKSKSASPNKARDYPFRTGTVAAA